MSGEEEGEAGVARVVVRISNKSPLAVAVFGCIVVIASKPTPLWLIILFNIPSPSYQI